MKKTLLLLLTSMAGLSGWALDQTDGVYQIGTPQDLVEFSQLVNGGMTNANAVLTADIYMAGVEIEPIGTYSDSYSDPRCTYTGTFDGQNHIIYNLTITQSDTREVGLFSRVQGGKIMNLGIVNANITNEAHVRTGVLGGEIHLSTVENCFTAGDIQVTTTNSQAGGIAGETASTTLTNCYTTFGTLANGGTYVNCYSGETAAAMAPTGELCYKLNGDQSVITWYQTMGEDAYPVLDPTHKQVYGSGILNCDGTPNGELSFSNTEGEIVQTPHTFVDGECSVCGASEQDEEGYYLLRSVKSVQWFANFVNNGNNEVNARLMSDLDFTGVDPVPIGCEASPYKGTFDGQFHVVSNFVLVSDQQGQGFFGFIAPPANISNMTLDNTCSITAQAYCGLIGESKGGLTGQINLTCLGNEGSVTASGPNAAGIFGCCMSSSATISIENCYTTGPITGGNESATITGWIGNNGRLISCWSVSDLEGWSDDRYLARCGSMTIGGCYGMSKGTTMPYMTEVTEEDLTSGALTYALNGGEMTTNPTWYQTLGSDTHPKLQPTHGIVYYMEETFGDVHDEASFQDFLAKYINAEQEYVGEAIATQTLLDDYSTAIDALADVTAWDDFVTAFPTLKEKRSAVETSSEAYATYIEKVEKTMAYLEEHAGEFEGPNRTLLEDYLESDEAPNEQFANGGARYIIETHLLTNEEIAAETELLDEMLTIAVASASEPGTEVTKLLRNSDFEKGFDYWEGKTATGYGASETSPIRAAECWSNTMDMYQTLEGLKNGIYELKVNGAFRPYTATEDYTCTNYAPTLYLNDVCNYFQADIEDMISVEDAVDGENCHLTGDVPDLAITDLDGNPIGYIMHGIISVCNAAQAGRYQNSVLVNVTDGTLKVGISQPGTGQQPEWLGFGNIKLFYLGTAEEANDQLDEVLASMSARANTLVNVYEFSSGEDFATYPNFAQALKDELKKAMEEVATTTEPDAKYALVERFSSLFKEVYDCKQAYINMMKLADSYISKITSQHSIGLIDDSEYEKLLTSVDAVTLAYQDGSYSAEEAWNVKLEGTLTDKFGPKLVTSVDQLSSNASDKDEGQHLEYLIDRDYDTFWHTDWHNQVADQYHYLQIDLEDEFKGDMTLEMIRRKTANDHPTEMIVWGSLDGEEYTQIATLELPYEGQGTPVYSTFNVETPVKSVRFAASNCTGESYGFRTFWHAAEMMLYGRNDLKQGFQYFMMEFIKDQGANLIQVSEFDLLDDQNTEYPLRVYSSTDVQHFDNEDPENLCDDDTSTKWCGNFTAPAYIFIESTNGAICPTTYRMYTANDTQSYSTRNPTSWRLWGSNSYNESKDDTSWVLIDERIDDKTMGATNYTPYDFTIEFSYVTAIESIAEETEKPNVKGIYDLMGRRVEKVQKGLYIINGKKVLVK